MALTSAVSVPHGRIPNSRDGKERAWRDGRHQAERSPLAPLAYLAPAARDNARVVTKAERSALWKLAKQIASSTHDSYIMSAVAKKDISDCMVTEALCIISHSFRKNPSYSISKEKGVVSSNSNDISNTS